MEPGENLCITRRDSKRKKKREQSRDVLLPYMIALSPSSIYHFVVTVLSFLIEDDVFIFILELADKNRNCGKQNDREEATTAG